MTLTWRPLGRGDVPAWTELLAAAEATDRTGENFTAEDLAHELGDPSLDLAADSLAVLDGDRLVAYGIVRGATEVRDRHHVRIEGAVHPRHRRRGIGRALLDRQLARAAELHARRHPGYPGRLEVGVGDRVEGAVALVKAAGLDPVRHWYDMECPLDGVDGPPPATSAQIVGFDPDRDDEVRRAHNEAFDGHYGSAPRDADFWRQWVTGSPWFRPETSLLAVDGGEVTGYLLGYFYPADAAVDGCRKAYFGQIGTRAAWRGRGVASALLATAVWRCAEAGYQRASLTVDSANATGAVALYERVGFRTVRTATTWARDIAAR